MALALHACGSATDHALLQAVRQRAAFVVSPCCVGKLKFSLAGHDARPAVPQAAAIGSGLETASSTGGWGPIPQGSCSVRNCLATAFVNGRIY